MPSLIKALVTLKFPLPTTPNTCPTPSFAKVLPTRTDTCTFPFMETPPTQRRGWDCPFRPQSATARPPASLLPPGADQGAAATSPRICPPQEGRNGPGTWDPYLRPAPHQYRRFRLRSR